MKYRFAYAQDRFQFHDAILQGFRFEGAALIMEITMLNVSKRLIPEAEKDMEIHLAHVTVSGFRLISFTDDENVSHAGIEAEELLHERLCEGFNFFSMEQNADGSYTFGATGMYPYFEVCFECEAFTLEWDEFSGIAWYER